MAYELVWLCVSGWRLHVGCRVAAMRTQRDSCPSMSVSCAKRRDAIEILLHIGGGSKDVAATRRYGPNFVSVDSPVANRGAETILLG